VITPLILVTIDKIRGPRFQGNTSERRYAIRGAAREREGAEPYYQALAKNDRGLLATNDPPQEPAVHLTNATGHFSPTELFFSA
jgi:hypothetical protein